MNHAPPPSSTAVPRTRNRVLLLALAGLFFGSLALAGALRFSGWRPAALRNHGELLQPPADLRALTPQLQDGRDYRWNPAARTWRVVLAPPPGCGRECAQTLREVALVLALLGRDAARVEVLWLCADTRCALPAGAPRPASLRRLRADAALRQRLPRVGASGDERRLPLYVIDPNGFVILRYAAGSDPGDLRSDLAKLLKLR